MDIIPLSHDRFVLCNIVCQLYMYVAGQWFFQGILVFSTNNTFILPWYNWNGVDN
jgi:hypothetical protein